MFSPAKSKIEELDLSGFKIVSSEMFVPRYKQVFPSCSLYPTKICFNKTSLQALNFCEFVLMQVNTERKWLLITPVNSKDKDSVRWVKGQKEIGSKSMESKPFCDELYKSWELNPEANYRATGRLVSVRNKVALLYDFSTAKEWTSNTFKRKTSDG